MKQVSVIAVRPFDWQGQSYVAGQALSVSVIDAVALAKKHHVTLTRKKAIPPPVVEPEPEPSPEPEPPKRRSYRRRDLQPEQTTVVEPEATKVQEIDLPERQEY